VTDCVVAVAGRDQVDRDRLAELAAPRHREDPWTGDRSGVRAPGTSGHARPRARCPIATRPRDPGWEEIRCAA